MIKERYPTNEEFNDIYQSCLDGPKGTYHIKQGFLFNGNRLCIPKLPLRMLLVKQVHGGSLA